MSTSARFEGVSKSYDGGLTWALDGIDLAVEAGEFMAFLGESGSGKTTTLMLLAGFETPERGRLSLDGRDLAGVPPWRRDLGVVFQSYALFPHMTVAENVGFALSVRRAPRDEIARAVARALDLVRLTGFGDRRPHQLSGGQQQRVALARALAFAPRMLLLDEPLGALDRPLRAEMQEELRRLHRLLGLTMIYVTHDQEEALALADRIAVFRAGRIVQTAPPLTLFSDPADGWVARFVGGAMLLAGRVVYIADGVCRLDLGDGVVLVGRGAPTLAVGAPAVAALRPGRVKPTADADAANRFDGVIEDVAFLGERLRVTIACAGDRRIVTEPETTAGADLRPGRPLRVAITPDDLAILPPGPEAVGA
jgi:putative spermidine/putrescine transport system ATP-binding protein